MSTLALSGWSARGLPCGGVSRGRARCPPPRPPISGCDRGAGCTGRRRGRRTTSGREAAGGSRRWTLLLPGAAWPSTLGEKLVSKISELILFGHQRVTTNHLSSPQGGNGGGHARVAGHWVLAVHGVVGGGVAGGAIGRSRGGQAGGDGGDAWHDCWRVHCGGRL